MEDKKDNVEVKKTRIAKRNIEKEETKKVVKRTAVKKDIDIKEEPKKVVKKEPEKKVEVKEIIVEKNNGFNYAEVIVIMIITLILGGVIGSFITFVSKKDNRVIRTVVTNNEMPSAKIQPKQPPP